METRHSRLRSFLGVLAILPAAAASMTACSDDSEEPADTVPTVATPTSENEAASDPDRPYQDPDAPLPTADNIDVDDRDATSVSEAALKVMFTRNAELEPDYRDGFIRAFGFLNEKLVDEYSKDVGEVRDSRPWSTWVTEGATVAVETEQIPGERPPETPTTAFRIVRVTEYPASSEGETMPSYQSAHHVTLTRENENDPWKIDVLELGARESI